MYIASILFTSCCNQRLAMRDDARQWPVREKKRREEKKLFGREIIFEEFQPMWLRRI